MPKPITNAHLNALAVSMCRSLLEMQRSGRFARITKSHLADHMKISPSKFCESSKTKYYRVLTKLFEETMIGKSGTGKRVYIKLMKPIEEIEAFFNEYKWDRRHAKTKALDKKCTIKKASLTPGPLREPTHETQRDLDDAKSICIKVKDVLITINF